MKPVISCCIVACCLLPTVPALAQIDIDPDGIGIYFDEGATANTVMAQTGDVVPAYLIGTMLSHDGDLGYWQAGLCPGDGADITGTPRGSYNYATNMPGDPCWTCVAMGFEPALPAQEITVLADLNIHVWGDALAIPLYIAADAIYTVSGVADEYPLNPSSGAGDLPVAAIFIPPLSTSQMSFGGVKALYR